MSAHAATPGAKPPMAMLMLGAIGVVFGDIGTSPLYTMKALFTGRFGVALTHDNVLGLLSVIFWSLIVVVTLKYATLVMRADNRGEGGVLALTALVSTRLSRESRMRWWLAGLGIFGAAMFFGDAMITPAVSVLGALEGIHAITPMLDDWVVPIAVVIIVALFAIQKHGTASVGKLFGPITILWFITLAILGAVHIVDHPDVLRAMSPYYAWRFIVDHPLATFLSLGAVVLAVTGTEALYTDMGHFGRSPIRRAWLFFVFPALLIFRFTKIGQDARIVPALAAALAPAVVVGRGAAHVDQAVEGTGATEHLAARLVGGAVVQGGDRLAFEFPVVAGMVVELVVAEGDVDPRVAIASPRLEQKHGIAPRFGQPRGDRTARGEERGLERGRPADRVAVEPGVLLERSEPLDVRGVVHPLHLRAGR